MSLFFREKKDGRRAPGYLLYLLGGLGGISAVALLHRKATVGGLDARTLRRTQRSDVGSITQAAAALAPVQVKDKAPLPDPGSYRLGSPPVSNFPERSDSGGPASESFDAIATALENPATASPAVHPETSPYAKLPPSFAAERDRVPGRDPAPSDNATRDSAPGLFGYRDASVDGAAGPAQPASESTPNAAAYLVPRGTLIEAYLLTDVDTGNPAAVIQFAAARTLLFNHREQLPFGTRFLGQLSGQAVRDRVNLTADTILYPDGLELPVSASAVEADDTGATIHPGVAAYYFPPPAWAQVAPYVSDFITGYMGLLQSRAQPQLTVGTGAFSIESSGGGSPEAPLYQASAQAIQNFTQARLKEIDQRYASHYLVPAGTVCWLQLAVDLDLSVAHLETGAAISQPLRALPRSASTPPRAAAPKSDAPTH
jgi:hypothetical protein